MWKKYFIVVCIFTNYLWATSPENQIHGVETGIEGPQSSTSSVSLANSQTTEAGGVFDPTIIDVLTEENTNTSPTSILSLRASHTSITMQEVAGDSNIPGASLGITPTEEDDPHRTTPDILHGSALTENSANPTPTSWVANEKFIQRLLMAALMVGVPTVSEFLRYYVISKNPSFFPIMSSILNGIYVTASLKWIMFDYLDEKYNYRCHELQQTLSFLAFFVPHMVSILITKEKLILLNMLCDALQFGLASPHLDPSPVHDLKGYLEELKRRREEARRAAEQESSRRAREQRVRALDTSNQQRSIANPVADAILFSAITRILF